MEDVLKIFKLFTHLMKCLGISCINIDTKSRNFLTASKSYNLLSNLTLIVVTATIALNAKKLKIQEEGKELFILAFIDLIYFYTPHINTLFIIVVFKWKEDQLLNLFRKLWKCVNIYKNYPNITIRISFLKKIFVFFITDFLLYNFVFLLARFGYPYFKKGQFDVWLVVVWCFFIYNYLLKYFTEIFYCVIISLIGNLFEDANNKLLNVYKNGTISDIRNVLRQHQTLCEISRNVSKVFSLQLLFLIGTHFKIIFINAFLLYADFGTNIQLSSLFLGSIICIKLYFCVYVSSKYVVQVI